MPSKSREKKIDWSSVSVCPRCGSKNTESIGFGHGGNGEGSSTTTHRRRCKEIVCSKHYTVTVMYRNYKLIERRIE